LIPRKSVAIFRLSSDGTAHVLERLGVRQFASLKIDLYPLRRVVIMNRKLTRAELEGALGDLPPVLKPSEAAKLLRIKVSTLYRHVSEGRYSGAVKRGKPLRFWRDRLIQEFMR